MAMSGISELPVSLSRAAETSFLLSVAVPFSVHFVLSKQLSLLVAVLFSLVLDL